MSPKNEHAFKVEKAYLEPYRKWLEALVEGSFD
jgi:hypothetical protein